MNSISMLILSMLAVVAFAKLRICNVDTDCKYDECCVLHFTGQMKICRDMGEDIGDLCGGANFCARCTNSLVCIPIQYAVIKQDPNLPVEQQYNATEEAVKQQLCPAAANATCQLDPSLPYRFNY